MISLLCGLQKKRKQSNEVKLNKQRYRDQTSGCQKIRGLRKMGEGGQLYGDGW